MNIPAKKILIILAFAVNIGLTLFGFMTLLDSPYTGIRMSVCGDHACVKSVDKDSPASGKVLPGDRVLDVEGLKISYLVFNEDPDYVKWERDFEKFWLSEYILDEGVVKGKPVVLLLERTGVSSAVSLVPVQFPFYRVLIRTLPIYIVGWTFLIVAYLIYRKKSNETTGIFLLMGVFLNTSWSGGIPFAVRDIAFHYFTFRILNRVDFVSALLLVCTFLHLALIFPKRIMSLKLHFWAIKGMYALVLLLVTLRFTRGIDNTYLSTYIPYSLCLIGVAIIYIVDYFIGMNAIARRQSKWVMFGTTMALVCYAGLSSIPILLGSSFVSVEIAGLVAIFVPVSFAFAITKYRLMEIDNIMDTAVVYGFTILVLAGVETAFLSFASPYLLTAGKGLPAFSVVAVLLIVFIYVPIRNFVKGIVERLFKRGKYDPEKELQQFTVSLGLCDERSALEKFSVFVQGLLKPSGIAVLKIEGKTSSILHASNDPARKEGESLITHAAEVWQHVRSKGTCTFGYELSEKIAQDSTDLESALFVPFITDPENKTSGYLAVLLKKWNETAYSVKDVTLLNVISVNIANIIEAGELRKERDAIEERFRKEKDAVMKELHDGLGNILTSITVTTQAAERMLEGARDKAGELVGRIGSFSTEAMDFLRTGLTVLDNPHGDIGSLMEAIKDRFGDMFESSGMELNIEYDGDAGKLRPGALVAMNLTRIIQEALNNVMKHSTAKSVRIRTEKDGDTLSLTISDDRKGFQVGNETPGLGLESMKRRIEDMKGSLRIDSSPGEGTEFGLAFPLPGRT